jgi:hypothetical protein
MMKKFVPWMMAIAIVILPAIVSACPLCKDTIAANANAQQASYGLFNGISSGFNLSIYCMFAGLFATLGLVTSVITKGVRSTNQRMKPPTDERNG